MKLNKNKIIVSALALAIGGSLAGSVGNTIAWYQYSTRANVAYVGEASGVSSNLQMRFVGEDNNAWRTRITWQEMNTQLGNGMKIVPMTFGALGKDAALPEDAEHNLLGYVQPAPGVGDMTKWGKATNRNYAQFKLELRNINREGETAANDAQDVFLTQLLLQKDLKNPEGKEDISNALRVHISANDGTNTVNRLISKQGGQVNTSGKLDIDGDGKDDKAYPEGDEFGFGYDGNNHVALKDVVYGDENADEVANEIQTAYIASSSSTATNPALVYSENNHLYDDDTKAGDPAIAKAIGKTLASESSYLTVTVTIWVEGWQQFDGKAIWDATKYIDSQFNVGIQFAVQDRQ